MNTCGYHNGIFPNISLMRTILNIYLSTTKYFVKICKGMYGLPQSGKLAYIALIKHLQLHGYTHACFIPGLFKHATRDTMFSLFVDDFEVKYTAKNDALHFIDTLKKNTPASLLIEVVEFYLGFTYIENTPNAPSLFPCLTMSKSSCQYFNIKT